MRRPFRRILRWQCPLPLPFLLVTLLALVPPPIRAHFALTFPETRYPPFDFLDNQRTVGPCGIPKSDRSPVTQFQAGKAYKISWRMAMEHKGGSFRLRLLDSTGKALDNWVMRPNGTALLEFTDRTNANSIVVQFPSVCRNCTLLMEKDVYEFGDQQVTEKGCAEVDISVEPEKPCLGKGKSVNGQCQCEQGFSGEQCQYRDDCTSDSDCGHGGRCIAGAIQQGQRSCFCPFGFIGTNCERRSSTNPNDAHCFAHGGPLNGSGNGSEVFVHGLFNPKCYSWKELNTDGDRLYWRLVGNQLELLLEFHTNSWLSLGWRPRNIPPSCRLFPQVHATAEDGHPRQEDGQQTSGFAKSALSLPLHPMDCTDVVMASVLEGTDLLHIADMYSRDRSSPLRDAWLDGEESLSAAYGLATADGRMVVMFRRMVPEIEPTDHPLGPGELFLIWAKGQPKKPKSKGFYADGQWKYHGDGGGRGHLHLEFVSLAQMGKIRGPLIHLDPPQGPTNTSEQRTEKVEQRQQQHNEEGEGKAKETTNATTATEMTRPLSVPTEKTSSELGSTSKSVGTTTTQRATTEKPVLNLTTTPTEGTLWTDRQQPVVGTMPMPMNDGREQMEGGWKGTAGGEADAGQQQQGSDEAAEDGNNTPPQQTSSRASGSTRSRTTSATTLVHALFGLVALLHLLVC